MIPSQSDRRRRPSSHPDGGRVRRPFTPQERLETAAVRKAGACKDCQVKKAKCRHTINHIHRESSHHSPLNRPYQPSGQDSNTPASLSVREAMPGIPSWSIAPETSLSGHTTLVMKPMPYSFDSAFAVFMAMTPGCDMDEPLTSGLTSALEDTQPILSWEPIRMDITVNDVYNIKAPTTNDNCNAKTHSSLNTPMDHNLDLLLAHQNSWLAFSDLNEDFFAMESPDDSAAAAEQCTQPSMTNPVGIEPFIGQNTDQISYTHLLYHSNDDDSVPWDFRNDESFQY